MSAPRVIAPRAVIRSVVTSSLILALPDKDSRNINVMTRATEIFAGFLKSGVLPRLSQRI
jgi:hypothetical protein